MSGLFAPKSGESGLWDLDNLDLPGIKLELACPIECSLSRDEGDWDFLDADSLGLSDSDNTTVLKLGDRALDEVDDRGLPGPKDPGVRKNSVLDLLDAAESLFTIDAHPGSDNILRSSKSLRRSVAGESGL